MSGRTTKARADRYRIVVYERQSGDEQIVMDATGEAFLAAVGTVLHSGRMTGEVGSGGPQTIQQHLADLVGEQAGA
jgi:hypothetical protein